MPQVHRRDEDHKLYRRLQNTVIKKILTHLDIFNQSRNQRAPPMPEPEYTDPEMELFDDGWPEYEEAVYEC